MILTENELYDLLRHTVGLPKDCFDELFRHAAGELVSLYGEKNVMKEGSGGVRILREDYLPSIAAEILFFLRGDGEDHERFLSRSRAAFLKVWRERARKNVKGEENESNDTEY